MDSDESNSDYVSEYESEVEDYRVEYTKQQKEKNKLTYKVLSQQDIVPSMQADVEKITCIFNDVTSTEARCLLQSCEWDTDLVVEVLLNGGTKKEKLYEKAGIEMKDTIMDDEESPFGSHEDEKECEICLDDVAVKDRVNLGCKHVFCIECLEASLKEDINNKKLKICCPGEHCKNLVSSDFIMKCLKDEKTRSAYIRLLKQSYIDSNPEIVWCPGTDCNFALKLIPLSNDYKVQCSNGHKSCFKCQQPWHDPLDCEMFKNWMKRSSSDANLNWISANTKDCPKCGTHTQKNGGCNHIDCKTCGYHWCWTCLGKFVNYDHICPTKVCESANKRKLPSEESAESKRYKVDYDR